MLEEKGILIALYDPHMGHFSPVLDPPSPVTQRQGERVQELVQDHLSAHARRLVSFLANDYCTCVLLAGQYGGSIG